MSYEQLYAGLASIIFRMTTLVHPEVGASSPLQLLNSISHINRHLTRKVCKNTGKDKLSKDILPEGI